MTPEQKIEADGKDWINANWKPTRLATYIAGRSAGLEREKELEEVLKLAAKKYADEMTNPFCMEWYKQATKLLNK